MDGSTAIDDGPFLSGAAATRLVRDVVEVTGPDAAEYLHGQVSQDVTGLAEGASAMTLLLQPQGKIDGWLRLTRLGPDRFWLDTDEGHGAAALERLQRFKLRVDCELTLLSRSVVAVRGPAAAGGPASLGLPVGPDDVVLDALWPGIDGFDLVRVGGGELPADLGLPEVAPEALDALRIHLGIPAMGSELDGSTIPAAAGIVDRSVDFTKGCYVGQELVARIDARGSNTPTRLCLVRAADGADVAPGTPVRVTDDEIATVTSFAPHTGDGAVGLAYVKRSVDVPAPAVVTDRAGDEVAVELVPLTPGG